jgi:hypothetical protein
MDGILVKFRISMGVMPDPQSNQGHPETKGLETALASRPVCTGQALRGNDNYGKMGR